MVGTILAMIMAATTGQCTKGNEDVPPLCRVHLPKITAITIEKNAAMAYRDPQGPKSCNDFKLNVTLVRRYLAMAKTTDDQSADATLINSPCFAIGTVTFADGEKTDWRIEQFGVGGIHWPKSHASGTLLYCDQCTFKPFRH